MNSEPVREAIVRFEEQNDPNGLVEDFLSVVGRFGLKAFTAADFSIEDRSSLLLYTSMPEFFSPLDAEGAWWSDDPIVARLASGEMRPFPAEDAWAEALPSAAPRWDFIVEAGLGRGWVFPTSKPGYVGGVHLISGDNMALVDDLPRHLAELHLIATYFHAFVTELEPEAGSGYFVRNTLGNRPVAGRRSKLAPREIDCLRWCAFGKTAHEIAIIEQLSVHTVRDYLKSGMAKLDSRTQAQAVARALKYGLFRI